MFTAALLVIAHKWKQLKCSSMDEWINVTYPYTGILFSNKKKWSTDSATTQMNFNNMPGERRHSQDTTDCMTSIM